jgi:hypothetical protein
MVKLGSHDDVYHIQAACEHGAPSFFDSPAANMRSTWMVKQARRVSSEI